MDLELAEAAEAAEERGEPKRAPEIRVSENTVVVQLLTRLVAQNQFLIQLQSSKRIHFPPIPGVRTARALLRERRRTRNRGRLLQLVHDAHQRYVEHGAPVASDGDQVLVEDEADLP